MSKSSVVAKILNEKLVVIIRTKIQSQVPTIVSALVQAGVKVLEITSNTLGYESEISDARVKYPNVLIGCGTVTTVSRAHTAIDAGAQFLVTPNVNGEVVKYAHQFDIPVLMGALTPSEVCQSVEAGADLIKIFPADTFGLGYIKALLGPLDNVPLFAVGGIGNEDAKEWLQAGASGLGVGGKLTKLKGDNDTSGIIQAAKELLEIIKAS